MISADITTYIIGILSVLLAGLGLYVRGQKYKINGLQTDVNIANNHTKAAKKIASVQKAKAELHKEVAREVVKNSSVAKEKIKRIQEKIDAVQDGEEFTISI